MVPGAEGSMEAYNHRRAHLQQLLLPPRCWCCGGKTPLCAAFDQTVGMPLLITISSLSRTPGQAVRGGPCPGPRFPLSD